MTLKKILLTLLVSGIILRCGVGIARSVIAFDIFVPFDTELTLKPSYNSAILFQNVYLYSSLWIYSIAGFVAMLIPAVILFLREKKEILINKGWLIMAAILFFLFIPYEIYSGILNAELSKAIFMEGLRDFGSEVIQDNFMKLFNTPNLRIWAVLSNLSLYTAVLMLVWRPLDGKADIFDKNCRGADENENG